MDYAWSSKTYLNSHRKDRETTTWILTEEGQIRAVALISHRKNARTFWTDTEFLGPVVANLGQWAPGTRPTNIPVELLAVIVYLWEHTQDFPDQVNSLRRFQDVGGNSEGVLSATCLSGASSNFDMTGLVVVLVEDTVSMYSTADNIKSFELTDPLSMPSILRRYRSHLQKRQREIDMTDKQKQWQKARGMMLRWSIAVASVAAITIPSFIFLPERWSWGIFVFVSFSAGFLAKNLK